MASNLKGSANVAAQISNDCAGQDLELNDDVTISINGDASNTAEGILLASNNGTVYKLAVSDAGALSAEAV